MEYIKDVVSDKVTENYMFADEEADDTCKNYSNSPYAYYAFCCSTPHLDQTAENKFSKFVCQIQLMNFTNFTQVVDSLKQHVTRAYMLLRTSRQQGLCFVHVPRVFGVHSKETAFLNGLVFTIREFVKCQPDKACVINALSAYVTHEANCDVNSEANRDVDSKVSSDYVTTKIFDLHMAPVLQNMSIC